MLGGSAGGWQRGWLSGYPVGKRAQAAPNWPPAGTRSTPSPSIQPRTRRPKSRDSSIGTSLLRRAQTPCTRRCTVTKPALPSHTAETRAGARSKATCPHVPGIPGGGCAAAPGWQPLLWRDSAAHTTSPPLHGWHQPQLEWVALPQVKLLPQCGSGTDTRPSTSAGNPNAIAVCQGPEANPAQAEARFCPPG